MHVESNSIDFLKQVNSTLTILYSNIINIHILLTNQISTTFCTYDTVYQLVPSTDL